MPHQSPQRPTPDKATPAWSRDLATLTCPWGFDAPNASVRWRAFLEDAIQYATYEDMPPALQAIYRRADRARNAGRSRRTSRK